MKIYYDANTNKLLTEEEAFKEAEKAVKRYELHLDYLNELESTYLWNCLTKEAQEKILCECVKHELEEDFISRDF